MLYTYAVISGTAAQVIGDPTRNAILAGAPPRCYGQGALAAVASAVPADAFGAEALTLHLSDSTWARDRILAHQAVVSDLLAVTTVLPMKFCTLFSGEAALLKALDRRATQLNAALALCSQASEWGIKLFFDGEAPVEAPTLAPDSRGAGTAFFRRKQDDRARAQAAEMRMADCVCDVHEDLARHARAHVLNPPQPAAIHRQPGRMVMNGAYLVPQDAEQTWRRAVDAAAARCAQARIRCEMTGPWAPYNFAGGALAVA